MMVNNHGVDRVSGITRIVVVRDFVAWFFAVTNEPSNQISWSTSPTEKHTNKTKKRFFRRRTRSTTDKNTNWTLTSWAYLHHQDNFNQQKRDGQQPIHVPVGIVEWHTSRLNGEFIVPTIRFDPRIKNTHVMVGSDERDQAGNDERRFVLFMHT